MTVLVEPERMLQRAGLFRSASKGRTGSLGGEMELGCDWEVILAALCGDCWVGD